MVRNHVVAGVRHRSSRRSGNATEVEPWHLPLGPARSRWSVGGLVLVHAPRELTTITLSRSTSVLAVTRALVSIEWALAWQLHPLLIPVHTANSNILNLFDLGSRVVMFILGAALIWAMLLLRSWARSGRLTLTMSISFAAAVTIGYANHRKLLLEGRAVISKRFRFPSHARIPLPDDWNQAAPANGYRSCLYSNIPKPRQTTDAQKNKRGAG